MEKNLIDEIRKLYDERGRLIHEKCKKLGEIREFKINNKVSYFPEINTKYGKEKEYLEYRKMFDEWANTYDKAIDDKEKEISNLYKEILKYLKSKIGCKVYFREKFYILKKVDENNKNHCYLINLEENLKKNSDPVIRVSYTFLYKEMMNHKESTLV